jgi:LmbE family N-acetylglucosaminyl deacetylase
MPFTLVSFHAHPDDEVLYTGGTLAGVARDGHRVVIVTATSGEAGLTSAMVAARGDLGRTRSSELHQAGTVLGAEAVVAFGYADSGLDGMAAGAQGFAHQDPQALAERLEEVLRAERADVLTIYDAAGGYGHPDHKQVHRVGSLAARRAGTPVVLEATVDRNRLRRALQVVGRIPGLPYGFHPDAVARQYAGPEEITHLIDVRSVVDVKREAMVAHASQATADGGARTIDLLTRLPKPLFRRVMGTEWFIEQGRPGGTRTADVFASLR